MRRQARYLVVGALALMFQVGVGHAPSDATRPGLGMARIAGPIGSGKN